MISRHIHCKPANDDYRRLARYIADANHEGEKCLGSWTAGCWMDGNYNLAVREVQDVQDLNTRSAQEKTYHLIVSFRPEDEAKLTLKDFQAIESEFAQALGFADHQRHCGVHKNTTHMHLHVAYNMIHPEKLTRHEPYRDYHKRDRVCRELEQRFDLVVDNGRDPDRPPQRGNDKAKTYEANSGQQSFSAYVRERKDRLDVELKKARTWQQAHEVLAGFGLAVEVRGNGCVIKDRFGKQQIKASELGREFSKGGLEKRFGPFRPGVDVNIEAHDRYSANPRHRDPERGQLWQEFLGQIEIKKERYESLKTRSSAEVATIREKWKRKQREIRLRTDLTMKDKRTLVSLAKMHSLKEENAFWETTTAARANIREEFPFYSWNGFLKMKAESGNEVALAVLQSLKQHVDEEEVTPPKPKPGVTHQVDNQGNILYLLSDGGMIKDCGQAIHFSANSPSAKALAQDLARRKFGPKFGFLGNTIKRVGKVMSKQERAIQAKIFAEAARKSREAGLERW